MEKELRPRRTNKEWRQCVRNIRTIQNIADRQIMVSTIAPEMKLQEVMELFARMQNNGRKVTKDDIETMLRGYRGGSSASSVNQELNDLDSENPWHALRNISDSRHGPSLTEPARYDYQVKASSPHHILVLALRMQPTCRDWVTDQALRDIDPDELVEHHLFSRHALLDTDPYHCLANTVLVSATTAKSIRAQRSPDQYLRKIAAQMPDVLRQQQIPEDPALWVPQNFYKLAAARTAMIADDVTDLIAAMQQGKNPSS